MRLISSLERGVKIFESNMMQLLLTVIQDRNGRRGCSNGLSMQNSHGILELLVEPLQLQLHFQYAAIFMFPRLLRVSLQGCQSIVYCIVSRQTENSDSFTYLQIIENAGDYKTKLFMFQFTFNNWKTSLV